MNTKILSTTSTGAIREAIRWIRRGQPIAFPTDTVYGLGAALDNEEAIDRLFTIKGREPAKAIAILLGDPAAMADITLNLSWTAARLAEQFWPGALTIVVERNPALPKNLSPLPTIGIRMPDHPFALELLRATGPLAVTSANLSGGANTGTAQEVYEQLHGKIPLILDGGQTPGGRPSTVVDCTTNKPQILRQGPVSIDQITAALL